MSFQHALGIAIYSLPSKPSATVCNRSQTAIYGCKPPPFSLYIYLLISFHMAFTTFVRYAAPTECLRPQMITMKPKKHDV
ncbi:hypothetical protein LguiB_034096 [Lonicera macranthoides]